MRVVNSLGNLLLLEVAQKGGGCLIPGKIKGEVAWGLIQLKMSLLWRGWGLV